MKIVFLLMLILVGCSSSEEPQRIEEFVDTEPPTVLSVFPDNEGDLEQGLDVDSPIQFIFSETLRESTIDFDFGLLDEDRNVSTGSGARPFSFSVSSDFLQAGQNPNTDIDIDRLVSTVFVSPPNGRRFPLNTILGLQPSSMIRDLSEQLVVDSASGEQRRGNLLGENALTYAFATREGEWKPTQSLICPELGADDLQNFGGAVLDGVIDFDIDSGGDEDSFIAWASGGDTGNVWVAAYDQNEGRVSGIDLNQASANCENVGDGLVTGAPVPVSNDARGVISALKVKRLGEGRVFVTWNQFSSSADSHLYYFNYFNGIEWLAQAVPLSSSDNVSQREIKLANQVGSRLLVSWVEEGAAVELKSLFLDLDESTDFARPQLLVSSSETISVLLSGYSISPIYTLPDRYIVLVNIGGESAPSLQALEYSFSDVDWVLSPAINSVTQDAELSHLRFDFDREGDGFAIWLQKERGRNSLWMARYLGRSWNASDSVTYPRLVEFSDTGNVFNPDVSVSQNSDAVISWFQESVIDSGGELLVRVYDADEPFTFSDDSWSFAELIDSDARDIGRDSSIRLEHDFEGDLTMVWSSQDGLTLYGSNLLRDSSNWSDPQVLSSTTSQKSFALSNLYNDGRKLLLYDEIEATAVSMDPETEDPIGSEIPSRRILKMTLFDELDQ